jgi:hypothetical protein
MLVDTVVSFGGERHHALRMPREKTGRSRSDALDRDSIGVAATERRSSSSLVWTMTYRLDDAGQFDVRSPAGS